MKGKEVLYHINRSNELIEKADKLCGHLISGGKADGDHIMKEAGVEGSLWDIVVSLKNYAEREKARYEQALNESEVNI